MSFIQEAVAQWVSVYGFEHQDEAWILSDYDTWHRNPYYTGPEVQHPEDYDYDEPVYDDGVDSPDYEVTGCEMTDVEADADTLASCGWGTDEDYVCDNDYFDDIPF